MKELTLWQLSKLVEITKATCLKNNNFSKEDLSIYGFSIDSRTVCRGDLFVAIRGDRDGHDYVMDAFKSGAQVALVSKIPKGYNHKYTLILVKDVLIALNQIARASRQRFNGLTIAVTGSVGKTTTKDMLKLALEPFGKVHASAKSFNNYLGVPISLASLPPSAKYAVFEIGMNSPGEIEPLSQLVNPDHVIITKTGKSHTEKFNDEKGIAKEKASISKGMPDGGKVLLSADGDLQDDIWEFLKSDPVEIIRFGSRGSPNYFISRLDQNSDGTVLKLKLPSKNEIYFKFSFLGRHFMSNAVGVLSILSELEIDLSRGILALSNWAPLSGRGKSYMIKVIHRNSEKLLNLIDDSYNSNPISLESSLETLACVEISNVDERRKVERYAILGDMLELGEETENEHKNISKYNSIKKIDKIYCVGINMKMLYDKLSTNQKGGWFKTTEDLIKELRNFATNADIILVKASNGFKFHQVIDKIKGMGKVLSH